MKATGIVRRIDDLGRVVIPKEIRRTMRIREGDPLEIYTDKDGEVIFKKYSMLSGLNEFANQICETIHKTVHQPALITDRDSIIALAGLVRREWVEKPISPALENILESRQLYRHQTGAAPFLVTESKSGLFVSLLPPSSHRAMCWAVFCWRTPKGVGSPARRNGLCWKPSPVS